MQHHRIGHDAAKPPVTFREMRSGLPIRKYRLADLLQQMPDVGDDEDFERSN